MLRSIITQQSLKPSAAPMIPHAMSFKRCGLIAASSAVPSRSMFSGFRRNHGSGVSSSPTFASAKAVFGRRWMQSPLEAVSSTANITRMQGFRGMNSDSHDDFGPVKKSIPPSNDKEVHDMIQDHVTKNSVMLYMKGNPQQPMCGFSATVTKILQSYSIDFSSVNVLDYPTLRDGIKTFSNWPTIPQLYINGEFIGGCDIVKTMHENGELKELLETIPRTTAEDNVTK